MGTDPTRTSGGSTDGATVRATVRATALSDLTGSMGAVDAVEAEELVEGVGINIELIPNRELAKASR